MKTRQIAALLASAPAVTLAWNHIGEKDFRQAFETDGPRLVAFVDPSTASCQTFEPEWSSIADQDEVTLMSVDCTSETQPCDEFEVISYPALRYFDGHGNMAPYRGPRKSSSIASFLKRTVRPAISILDEKSSGKFQAIDDIVVVAHLNPRDDHVERLFRDFADTYRDRISFGALETSGATGLICYNNKDGESAILSDLSDVDAIPKFVKACAEPLIGEFTRVTELKYLQPGKSLVYFLAEKPEEREAYVEAMRPVAKKYREYLRFVTVDAIEYAELAAPLGLPAASFPSLAVQNPAYGQVFPYAAGAKITPIAVEAFVTQIVQGKVKPWDGTPPAPPAPDAAHDEL